LPKQEEFRALSDVSHITAKTQVGVIEERPFLTGRRRYLMKKARLLAAVVSLAGFMILSATPMISAQAEEDEISRLRQRIAELELKIQQLENLLKQREEIPKGQDAAFALSDEGWQNTKNWRELEIGMSEDRVRAILGEPIKVIHGVRTLWYYPNIYCGYVSFDRNGRLSGWNEP
jgi:hypothetical protein